MLVSVSPAHPVNRAMVVMASVSLSAFMVFRYLVRNGDFKLWITLVSVVVTISGLNVNDIFLITAVEEIGQFLVDNLVVSGRVEHGLVVNAGVCESCATGEQGDGGDGECKFKCFHGF